MRRVYKNLCPAITSASIMAANMWKNSLKNVESDNNIILHKTLLDFFLQRNGTYFLNKPCTFTYVLTSFHSSKIFVTIYSDSPQYLPSHRTI